MKEYFYSFTIKSRLEDGGHKNTGYGQGTVSAGNNVSIELVLEQVISDAAKKYSIESRMIHVNTFNGVI